MTSKYMRRQTRIHILTGAFFFCFIVPALYYLGKISVDNSKAADPGDTELLIELDDEKENDGDMKNRGIRSAECDIDAQLNGEYPPAIFPKITRENLIYNETLGLYAYDGWRVVIWSYWDWKRMPSYIKLSIITWMCHNEGEAHFIAPINTDTVAALIQKLHPAFFHLSHNHKSDYIRGHLLYQFGGIWMDADALTMAPAVNQIDYLRQGYDSVGFSWNNCEQNPCEPFQIGVQVLGPVKAKGILYKTLTETVGKKLDLFHASLTKKEKRPYPFQWGDMMTQVLPRIQLDLVNSGKLKYKLVADEELYGQMVNFRKVLAQPCDLHKTPLKDSPYLYYFQSEIPPDSPLRGPDIFKFVREKTVLGKLIALSLQKCESELMKTCPFRQVIEAVNAAYSDCLNEPQE